MLPEKFYHRFFVREIIVHCILQRLYIWFIFYKVALDSRIYLATYHNILLALKSN